MRVPERIRVAPVPLAEEEQRSEEIHPAYTMQIPDKLALTGKGVSYTKGFYGLISVHEKFHKHFNGSGFIKLPGMPQCTTSVKNGFIEKILFIFLILFQ